MDPVRATSPGFAPPWDVHVVESTGSTNVDLLAMAAAGAPDRTVLAARHQSAGRGRLDRRWDAPPGTNLLVSLLLRKLPEHVHELTWRVGLAACAAVHRLTGREPTLKWPNDVLLDGRKLAGVLAQAAAGGVDHVPPGDAGHVVVGIGLNVRWAPEGASLLGADIDPLDVLAALLDAYDQLPDDVWTAYRQHLSTIGRDVRVHLPDGAEVVGRAVDVDRGGHLVVRDERSQIHRFAAGDVVHLR